MKNNNEKTDFKDSIGEFVEKLENLDGKKDEDKIIKILQKINIKILENKIIVGDTKYEIYPLWVEAYYRNDDKNFIDESCHMSRKGDCVQYKFRLHEKIDSTSNRRGIDLYLGSGDSYYLSFLIKIAYIKNDDKFVKCCSQNELLDYLPKNNDFYNNELDFKLSDLDYSNCNLINAPRCNLRKKNNEKFNELLLAVFYENINLHRTYSTLLDKYQLVNNKIFFKERDEK